MSPSSVILAGDTAHELVHALAAALPPVLAMDAMTVIVFSLFLDDGSVDTGQLARSHLLQGFNLVLESAVTLQRQSRCIYVTCTGSAADVDMAFRFRNDYGIPVCVIDLGVLYGSGISSVVGDFIHDIRSVDGKIRMHDSPDLLRFTCKDVAIAAILHAMSSPSCAGTLRVSDGDESPIRISLLASRVSQLLNQQSQHFLFSSNESEEEENQAVEHFSGSNIHCTL